MAARALETGLPPSWQALVCLLTLGALATTGAALFHICESLLRGPICGATSEGHCWACYAAPVLAALAASAWRAARAATAARGRF